MQIRARCREHLVFLVQRFDVELKKYKIIETLQGDYAYRIELPKRLAALIMRELVEEQTWDNFKKETKRYQTQAAGHPKYEKVLMDVYFDAGELQEGGPYSSGVLSGLRSLNNKDFQSAGTQVKDIHMGDKFKVPVGSNTFRLLPAKTGKLATTTMEKLFKRKKK